MDTKICTKCGEEKPATTEYFYRRTRSADELCACCKRCRADDQRDYVAKNKAAVIERRRSWYSKNKKRVALASSKWKKANPEKARASVAKWNKRNPQWAKQYYAKNAEAFKARGDHWRNENREEYRRLQREWAQRNKAKRLDYVNKRYHTDPAYRIFKAARDRLSRVLNKYSNGDRVTSTKQIGASAEELRRHIEGRFRSGMTWENYGRYSFGQRTWHAHHLIPLCGKVSGERVFNPFDPEEVSVAANKYNLTPEWAEENIVISDTVPHWDDIPKELQDICTPRIRDLLKKVKKTA